MATELDVDATAAAPARSSAATAAAPRRCAACTPGSTSTAAAATAVELWAYGDSPGDRELLADADHAVWAKDVGCAAVPRGRDVSAVPPGCCAPARPRQWLKNVLVFAAPGAAACSTSWADARADGAGVRRLLPGRQRHLLVERRPRRRGRPAHPTKRTGRSPPASCRSRTAKVVGTRAAVAALGVAAAHRAVADGGRRRRLHRRADDAVQRVAGSTSRCSTSSPSPSGFVLRAAGGAVAVDVPMSNWFVLVTVFGSLFIVTGKRYAELREIGEDAAAVRATLADYTSATCASCSPCRAARRCSATASGRSRRRDETGTDWPFYELSIVPHADRAAALRAGPRAGRGAAPEEVFASDRVLQAARRGVGGRVRAGGVRAMTAHVRGGAGGSRPTSTAG